MSVDEYKTHFSLWAMVAVPLIAGNDIRAMSPDIAGILLNKEVIAIDQDALGVGAKRISSDGEIEVWTKPLASGDVAVAVFNHESEEMPAAFPWVAVGADKSDAVRDLWAHAELGKTSDVSNATVRGHGAVLLRVKRHS